LRDTSLKALIVPKDFERFFISSINKPVWMYKNKILITSKKG